MAFVNCTADPDQLNCTLKGVGDGLGTLFDEISVPLVTLLLLIGIAGAVVAIITGVIKIW